MQVHEQALQIFLIGLANGSLIALVALGYTLVYGIIELINFAHGDVFMIGTMAALTIVTWGPGALGLASVAAIPLPLATALLVVTIVVPMLLCGGLNVLIERFAYRRLRRAPRLAPLISAIGVSFILVN